MRQAISRGLHKMRNIGKEIEVRDAVYETTRFRKPMLPEESPIVRRSIGCDNNDTEAAHFKLAYFFPDYVVQINEAYACRKESET